MKPQGGVSKPTPQEEMSCYSIKCLNDSEVNYCKVDRAAMSYWKTVETSVKFILLFYMLKTDNVSK